MVAKGRGWDENGEIGIDTYTTTNVSNQTDN